LQKADGGKGLAQIFIFAVIGMSLAQT